MTNSTISDTDYQAHVDALISQIAGRHALGQPIEVADSVIGLEMGRPANKKVRDYLVKNHLLTASDFDKAIRSQAAAEAGYNGSTPRAFVAQVAAKLAVTAQYNGLLTKHELPYLDVRGGREYIPAEQWDAYVFKSLIATRFHCSIGFDEFARTVRMIAVEYGLPFKSQQLDDASDDWFDKTCKDRLWQITAEIDYTDTVAVREQGQASLRLLAQTCFDCEHGAEFVVAVFNKFIWQVKRKINRIPVTDHLMPVILGPQRSGKSTLIRQLLHPIDELWVPSDFRQITDDRNTMLWRNFAIFLDEMGFASKSDMETVKNVITTETLNRRIMRTTNMNVVPQNATFIGAANANELADLIRDVSGTRRFIALDMKATPDRDVINFIDWRAVWQSVDETASDPMAAFKGVLQAVQADDRTKSPVEDWIDSLDAANKLYDAVSLSGALREADRQFSGTELFGFFAEYERRFFPANRGTNIIVFSRELNARCRMADGRFVRSGKKSNARYYWRDSVLGGRKPHLV